MAVATMGGVIVVVVVDVTVPMGAVVVRVAVVGVSAMPIVAARGRLVVVPVAAQRVVRPARQWRLTRHFVMAGRPILPPCRCTKW